MPPIETARPDMVGSAGSLVAAGLETAGHYLQSNILDMFETGVNGSLGTLLFTASAVSAVLIIAVGGKYKFGLWFLVGPILFYLATTARTPSAGVRWQMGDRGYSQEMVKDATVGVYGGSDSIVIGEDEARVGRVSWVFATWDRISSGIIHTVIRALNVTDINADLDYLTKTSRYMSLFQIKLADSDLQQFLHVVFFDNCSHYLALQQQLVDPGRIVDANTIQAQADAVGAETKFYAADRSGTIIQSLIDKGYFGSPAPTPLPSYTCKDLWELAKPALRQYAVKEVSRVAGKDLPAGLTVDESMKTLAAKFRDTRSGPVTDQDVTQMIDAIGMRLIQQELGQLNSELSKTGTKKHMAGIRSVSERLSRDRSDPDTDLRTIQSVLEYKGYGEYISFILGMPYLQGIALYFLAMAYPFFCFMLIIPGRHHAFILWMGLWFWVKSWDLGFAVLMLIDKLLFYLLPQGPAMSPAAMENPAQAFQLVLRADPGYTAAMAYGTAAGVAAAMPFILGLGLKRGGGELMDALSQGMNEVGGKIGGALQSYAGSWKAQENATIAEKVKLDAVRASAVKTLMGDSEIQSLLNTRIMVNGAGGIGRDPVNQFMSALNKVTDPYARQVIDSKFRAAMATEAFSASIDPKNKLDELADRTVLLGYYRHSFGEAAPQNELLNLKRARTDMNISRGAREGVTSAAGGTIKATGDAAAGALKGGGGAKGGGKAIKGDTGGSAKP